MSAEQRQQLHTLIKKYNIHFVGETSRHRWPINHAKTFNNIRRLGATDFLEYRDIVTIESDEKPWREQTRRRAKRIAALAKFCRDGRKNEAGWRMSLESEILARFTIEVACRRCRARLWRSELEASAGMLDSFTRSLEERQKRRSPCICRPRMREEDPSEQGVNPLFDDRAQETIVQEAALKARIPKKSEPDRIYGLRMTKRLERLLLWTEDKRATSGGKPIGECISTSPFRPEGGDPIIFPFLALEAKSEKGRDAFSDVEAQTAFTIRALLKLQDDLRKAAGEDSQWESGPLVWFFENKGEQWRVAAAYIDYYNREQHFTIVDLWDGRVTSDEGALRLLLIVDYIFDWARDVYREAIVGELRALSASNNSSLGNDSDIFSTVDRVAFWPQEADTDAIIGSGETEVLDTDGIRDALRTFDSPHGVVRNAKYIRSRLMALHLTEDNLSLLIKSMKTPEKAQEAAQNILRCLNGSWRVTAETLDRIELMWTGNDRENTNLYSPDKVFYVVVTVTAYLTPTWEQTRELCYLAVSEKVIEDLFEHVALKRSTSWDASDFPYIGQECFVGSLEAFRRTTMHDNLIAAISRACLSTKLHTEKSRVHAEPDKIWVESTENVKNGTKYRFDAVIMADRQAPAREFVSSIYNLHKIGRNEPSTSLLRISTRVDEQEPNLPLIDTPWLPAKSLGNFRQKRLFFILSKNPSNASHYAELCVFITDEHATEEIYKAHPTFAPDPPWQFQARRLDSGPGWGRGWNNSEIQVKDDNFPKMFTSFYSHLETSTLFSGQKSSQAPKPQSPGGISKQRKCNTDLMMSTNEPAELNEVIHFYRMATAEGIRVRSITNYYTAQSRNRAANRHSASRKGKAVDTGASQSTLSSRNVQDTQTLSLASSTGSTSEDFPSLDELIGNSARTPTKRAYSRNGVVVEEEGESSSRNSKRSRTDSGEEFARDYLDQDELDQLISKGYFT